MESQLTEPISFPSVTNTFELPLLFTGQAQKEFVLNQSLFLLDALLRQSVVASIPSPPSESADGESYIVGNPADGDWEGHDDQVAIRIGGAWRFVQPFEGMRLFDQSAGHTMIFASTWSKTVAPSDPQGGDVVDVQARAAIAELSQALRGAGVFASEA